MKICKECKATDGFHFSTCTLWLKRSLSAMEYLKKMPLIDGEKIDLNELEWCNICDCTGFAPDYTVEGAGYLSGGYDIVCWKCGGLGKYLSKKTNDILKT